MKKKVVKRKIKKPPKYPRKREDGRLVYDVLFALNKGDQTVKELLTKIKDTSNGSVSTILGRLRGFGAVSREKYGREYLYTLNKQGLNRLRYLRKILKLT